MSAPLTEQEALQFTYRFNELPEAEKPEVKERLRSYRESRAGQPVFPSQDAARAKARALTESLWLDGDDEYKAAGGNAWWKSPEERQTAARMSYLADQGADIQSMQMHGLGPARDRLARAWGNDAVLTDDGVLDGEIKKRLQASRDERYLIEGFPEKKKIAPGDRSPNAPASTYAAQDAAALAPLVRSAALDGKPWSEAYGAWQAAASSLPGYQEKNAARYEAIAREVHSGMAAQVAAVRPTVAAVMAGLRSERENAGAYGGEKLVDALQALPPESRGVAMYLISKEAEGEKVEAGSMGTKAFGRGSAAMLVGTARTWSMDDLEDTEAYLDTLKPGDEVGGRFASKGDKPGEALLRVQGPNSGSAETDVLRFVLEPLLKNQVVTAEDIEAARALVAKEREKITISMQLEAVAKGQLDPIKGRDDGSLSGWLQRKIYHPFMEGAAPQIAAVALTRRLGTTGTGALGAVASGAGTLPLLHGMMADQNAQQLMALNPGMDARQAFAIGRNASYAQTGLEYLSTLSGLGAVGKSFGMGKQLLKLQGAAWKRFGLEAGKQALIQNATEAAQDILPVVVQSFTEGAPSVQWQKFFYGENGQPGYWTQRADTFWAVLPLVLFGAGGKTVRDQFQRTALEQVAADISDVNLHAAGIAEADRAAILAADGTEGKLDALSDALPRATDATAKEGRVRMAAERAESEAALDAEMRAAEVTLRVVPGESGPAWEVTRGDTVTRHATATDAGTVVMEHLQASGRAVSQEEAAAAWGVIESIGTADAAAGIESRQLFRGKERRATRGEDGKVAVMEGIPGVPSSYKPLDYSPESLVSIGQQMQALGLSSAVIRGSNRALRDDAGRLVRYYETNAGADITTILHERVETLWKDGGEAGGQWFEAANQLSMILSPEAAKTDGERAVAESLRRIAIDAPDVSAAERRETLVELIVADYLGRFRDGKEMEPGSFQAGVAAAAMASSGPKRKALESLKRLIAVVRRYLGAMFGVAKAIREARTSGKIKPGDAWDSFANSLLGLDEQVAHEEAVVQAVQESADSFSLAPTEAELVDAIDSWAQRQEKVYDLMHSLNLKLNDAARDIGDTDFAQLTWEQQQEAVATLQANVGYPITLERSPAGTVVRARTVDALGEPQSITPRQTGALAPVFADPATAPGGPSLVNDETGQSVRVPVWLGEALTDNGIPESGILYAVAGHTGNVDYTMEDEEIAHDYMRTMASKGNWLWKIDIWKGSAELIGGVPLRQPQAFDAGSPFRNETPRMAGNVPLFDPYGSLAKIPESAIRYGRTRMEGANGDVIIKRMPSPDVDYVAGQETFSLARFSPHDHIAESIAATDAGIYTDEDERRKGHAGSLLRYAQESFKVKHSRDLTTDGKAFRAADGTSYSLGSVNTLEAIAARLEERRAAGGAAVKLEAYADLSRRLEGMARAARGNEETEAILRAGEIEEQRKRLQQELLDEKMLALYSGPLGEILTADESAAVRDDPFLQQFLASEKDSSGKKKKGVRGIFLSRQKGKGRPGEANAGEYEDAAYEGIPDWMFRGTETPDNVATSMGFTVPEMWQKLGEALASNAKLRARNEKEREAVAEAKAEALKESRAWATSERAKLASSDKRDSKRALVTLDAILAELPAEVRKKVGGFTDITELKTDASRRKRFLSMVDKIDVAFEDWLRGEFVSNIQDAMQKAAALKRPGEKDKGKLGVNAHTWLEVADSIMRMNPIRLAEREAFIEKHLGGEPMTPEIIADFNRAWDFGTGEDAAMLALEQESGLLDLFGGIAHRDKGGRYLRTSSEMEAAFTAMQETIDKGRNDFAEVLRARRDRRAGRRAGVILDSGKAGRYSERQEANMEAEGLGGQFRDYLRKGMNFEQFLGDVFGRESDTHRWAEDTVMQARLTSEGLWQDAQGRLTNFLQTLWPKSSKVTVLRNLEALQKSREVPGAGNGFAKLSELEAIHFTMLWSDPDSREWLNAHGFGDGKAGADDGPDVQAALESMLSPAALKIRAFLVDAYDSQYDSLNEVFRKLHGVNMPRVRNYSPRTVLSGKEAAVADPLSGGQVTARGVFAGFTKRRRPQISASPQVTDALVAFVQNQRVVSHFLGWAETSNELRAVFSTSETAPYIEAAAGRKGLVALNEWLSDLEQNGVREAIEIASLNRWLRANADNALVGKLGVLAKQLSAVWGSATELGWGEYARSAGRLARGQAVITADEAAELPVMKQRIFNRPAEVGQAAAGSGPRKYARALRRAGVPVERIDLTLDFLRERIGATDAFFTAHSAAIAYDAKYREAIAMKMSDTGARAYAEREMTRAVFRTAQPDNVATKSKFENRSPAALRLLFAFQSMNRQMLFSTVAAFRDGGIKNARAWRLGLTHWALTGFVSQLLGATVRDWMSDDDEDKDWQAADFARAMVLGPLTGALHIGPVIEATAAALGWGYEQRQAPGIAASVGTTARVLAKAIDSDDGLTGKQLEQGGRAIGMAGQAAFGGFWSGLNVFLNIGKQGTGVVDNAISTATGD